MDIDFYKTLITQPIDIYNYHVRVTEDKILDILGICYENTAFSTIPYFYHNQGIYIPPKI